MANTLLTTTQITNEALRWFSEAQKYKEFKVLECSGNWLVVETHWGKQKHIVATYPTKEEAEAVLKIINFTEGN